MIRSLTVLLLVMAAGSTSDAGEIAIENFEHGFKDGEPVHHHKDWYSGDQSPKPTIANKRGVNETRGVLKGDRSFIWTKTSFQWADEKLESITLGGDWQTDDEGLFDDDRLGWTITDDDDTSSNIFGVQMDEASDGDLNVEVYWDGPKAGDDAGRGKIISLKKLKPKTWYRLRAKFTKLTATSTRIDVGLVELDAHGQPTLERAAGVVEDTAKLNGRDGFPIPNPRYFAAPKAWPVFKNYRVVDGGFDNAYFEVEYKD